MVVLLGVWWWFLAGATDVPARAPPQTTVVLKYSQNIRDVTGKEQRRNGVHPAARV